MTKAKVIDGKAFSENLVARVTVEAKSLAAKIGRPPALAVVLVGEDPASAVYVRNKIERTTAAGMRSIEHRLDATTSQAELLALIDTLNEDDAVMAVREACKANELFIPNQVKRERTSGIAVAVRLPADVAKQLLQEQQVVPV